jgi:peptidase M28-like protein/PA domain-containing protein
MLPARALGTRHRSVAGRLATLAVAVALASCSPASSPSIPSSSGLPAATSGASQPTGSGALAAEPALAAALRDAVGRDAILADLQRLQDIAEANGGNRAAGSESESEALAYVADELRAAGFEIELREMSVPWFNQVGPSILEVDGGAPLEDLHDFKAMLLSASGDARGPIYALGFDPAARPGDRSGLGCQPTDWGDVPAGAIVLVRPGPCFRRDVVVNAQEAGAVAIVTAYPEWQRDQVLRPTLIDPGGMEIPALATSNDTGLALADAAQRGAQGHVVVDATAELRTSSSLVAETAGGSPDHVLMIGGHIDSAMDGPGINDNGSGTMTILEIGRRLAAATSGPQSPAGDGWTVRLAFWTGEEIGLLGSSAYVEGLDSAEIGTIEAYLNFDMLGSPNGVREVYSGAATTRPTESEAIAGLFTSALDRAGLSSSVVELPGGADHASFNNFSIPTGGLFSGANEIKSPEQATLFGGTAGAPEDPCYHLACDRVDNLDPVLLEELARAAAWVVGALASGEVTLRAS